MRGLFPPEVRDQIEADSTGPDPVRFFYGWMGEKHGTQEKHQELCEPLGLYPCVRRFGGGYGQRLGLPQQNGQQRRRRIFTDLSAVCFYFQLCGPSGGVCHGPPCRHRYAGRLRKRLGHPQQVCRQSRRSAGLAASGWLPVHRHRLCRHRHLCAQGSGGFPAGHTADHGHRRLVRCLLLHPLLRDPLSHRCGGGHAADAVSGRPQH